MIWLSKDFCGTSLSTTLSSRRVNLPWKPPTTRRVSASPYSRKTTTSPHRSRHRPSLAPVSCAHLDWSSLEVESLALISSLCSHPLSIRWGIGRLLSNSTPHRFSNDGAQQANPKEMPAFQALAKAGRKNPRFRRPGDHSPLGP